MADDDWDPDLDFPGLDSSAVITDVGVDQFVLCHQVRALQSLLASVLHSSKADVYWRHLCGALSS